MVLRYLHAESSSTARNYTFKRLIWADGILRARRGMNQFEEENNTAGFSTSLIMVWSSTDAVDVVCIMSSVTEICARLGETKLSSLPSTLHIWAVRVKRLSETITEKQNYLKALIKHISLLDVCSCIDHTDTVFDASTLGYICDRPDFHGAWGARFLDLLDYEFRYSVRGSLDTAWGAAVISFICTTKKRRDVSLFILPFKPALDSGPLFPEYRRPLRMCDLYNCYTTISIWFINHSWNGSYN